ncbi:probable galactinol--sucrose galactosyltransferase 2 [Andrographis paniculata]|uniref:probable galactinol--sucrose galactosyltransferase 2 n=1 Tax=Andrographis paniculata TaxID=175694 RepID=UPI0021E81845|nr:probable galactinol--sucrose galactosyltransferase 2 [Andrographis paniculata]
MTITADTVISNGGCLMVRGKVVLTGVPKNVLISPAASGSTFIGATSVAPSSRHIFDLGLLRDSRFMCLFIPKIWWMIPRVGNSGRDIPGETQMLLLEIGEESALGIPNDQEDSLPESSSENKYYVLLLAVADRAFRATLQGTADNHLQFCYESGDPEVKTSQATEGVFVNSGDNPFELIKDSIKILAKHTGTFSHLENKKIPAHLDWFGWCTWDAFYTEVSPKGIKDGLQSFKDEGISPKFLIIDDGWQETENEYQTAGQPSIEGAQFAARLTDIKENHKFKRSESDGSTTNLRDLIHDIKENYGLKYVYMWHALAGYWGGVSPSSEAMKKYDPKLVHPIQSPGQINNIRDIAMDSLEKYGVGLIDPRKVFEFYNDMHSYLAGSGVDGVKVDVQNVLATLGSGYGGRVSITKQYHEALDESVEKNFRNNNLICCMCHNSDSIFSSNKSAAARASEDFMPNEPTFQTLHIASVSFNSLLLGEIVVPDWDMFHSKHGTAEFHGAARAIGGCPVYVSDKPGEHDFKILRKLVLPDGSILRARYAGRPTRDCLFIDPVMDGKSLLKIWNLNKLTGVVGVFNCQGAGVWAMKEAPPKQVENSSPADTSISGRVSPLDVESLEDITGEHWSGECAVYAYKSGSLRRVTMCKSVGVSLPILKCEIFTISPIKVLNDNVHFAPIGLINMYNSGGAVEECSLKETTVTIKARGSGLFGVYSSMKPCLCKVDKKIEDFSYCRDNGLMTIHLQTENIFKEIEIVY